ncbi:MAG: YfjI family protein, partial [Stackebrandtia sp.]
AVIARKVAEATAERTEKTATERPLDATARGLASDARLALDDTAIPAEPKLFGGNDSTTEKVTSRLAEQNSRYAVLAPEGGKLLSIAGGRYSGSPDIGVFLSGHAGEEIRIERIGRPSERIDAATLTLGICLQPGVLASLGDTPEFREQGLLGRLLVSMPESLLGRRNPNPDPVRTHIADAYHHTLKTLVLSLREHGDPGHQPTVLTLTADAQRAVVALLADIEPRLAPGTGDLAHMTDWAGKYVGAIVRIAALVHLGKHLRDGYHRPIDLPTLQDAIQLGEYFTTHAQAAYDAIGADPAVNHARTILDWAHRNQVARFTARDLMRGPMKGGRVRKVADLEPALHVLQ